MAIEKPYVDESGNEYPASYWRTVQLNIASLEGGLNLTYYGWRDAAAFGEGKRPVAGASRVFVVVGEEFAALATAPPQGGTLHDALANACDDYALADPFFADGVRVGGAG